MNGPWVTQLGGRLYVRNYGAEVIGTVELLPAGGWHAYVSEPSCSWSYSETFTDQATALGAADTAAAWWALHATETAGVR